MTPQRECTATRQRDGAYEVSAIVSGYLVRRVYYGYTKREAVRCFVRDIS